MSDLYIIMGPAGSGKSTIAGALSERMRWTMVEADTHHPQENVDKQAGGVPLTDADRAKWLDSMINHINRETAGPVVLACSALTPYVQNRLQHEVERSCVWLLLDVPKQTLAARLRARANHFMPASLLDDQLQALTSPPQAITINADQPIPQICDAICHRISRLQHG
ncbi:MAG: gluconokinase [Pseudomonadota bacterium]